MTLALPSFGVWLLGFYSMFHCGMNIVAELLRFADRCALPLAARDQTAAACLPRVRCTRWLGFHPRSLQKLLL